MRERESVMRERESVMRADGDAELGITDFTDVRTYLHTYINMCVCILSSISKRIGALIIMDLNMVDAYAYAYFVFAFCVVFQRS